MSQSTDPIAMSFEEIMVEMAELVASGLAVGRPVDDAVSLAISTYGKGPAVALPLQAMWDAAHTGDQDLFREAVVTEVGGLVSRVRTQDMWGGLQYVSRLILLLSAAYGTEVMLEILQTARHVLNDDQA